MIRGRNNKLKKSSLICLAIFIAGFIGMSSCVVPQSYAAWDGYTEVEATKFTPIDFDSFTEILGSGGIPSELYASDGHRYSIEWKNHTVNKDIWFPLTSGAPTNWEDCLSIKMSIYSEKATKAEIMFIVYSDSTANYFYKKFYVDWEGWKEFEYKLSDFSVSRQPSWETVTEVRFVGHGNWSITGNPETSLYISDISLQKGDPTSSMSFYDEEDVKTVLSEMENSVAVYGGGVNGVSDLGALELGYEIPYINKTTLVPAKLMADYLGASISDNGTEFSLSLGETVIHGKKDEAKINVNGEEKSLSIAPVAIDGKVFFPGEEVSKHLGFSTYTDGRLLVIGTDVAVKSVFRPEHLGVNEKNEIVSYLSYHRPSDLESYTPEDTVSAKDNWRRYLVGNKELNSSSDADVRSLISNIDSEARKAWNQFIREENQTELFEGMVSTASAHMTTAYTKLYAMTRGWATYGTSLYQNEDLKDDILYGIDWMHHHRYKSNSGWVITGFDNWWDWYIGSSSQLMPTLLLLEDHISRDDIKTYCTPFDTVCPLPNQDGGNYTDIAKCVLMSALMQNDYKRVLQTRSDFEKMYLYVDDNERLVGFNVYGEDRIARTPVKGAGFFTDGSYILHTLHAMNATYGPTHFEALCLMEKIFEGTPFATNTPFKYNVPEVFYNVFNSVIYGTTVYRHVLGRSDVINNFNSGTSMFATAFSAADSFPDEDRDKIYRIVKTAVNINPNSALQSRLCIEDILKYKKFMADDSIKPLDDISENRVFYNMDKVVHKRNDWSLGIAMSSLRMFNYESINNQNMKGWYQADGRTEWYLLGDNTNANTSYWSTMDPYRLPGTTVDTQERKAASIANGYEYLSSKDFVGGVSHNKNLGVAAMDLESYHMESDYGFAGTAYGGPAPLHQNDLVAKKSYFMFDDEFVCLGSGINAKANNDAEVLTIVDNLLADKTVNLSNKEVSVPYEIKGVEASDTPEAENVAANTIDEDIGTKWAAKMDAEIVWDLGEQKELGFAVFAFASGNTRQQKFELYTSADGEEYVNVFKGSSSGKTDTNEAFDLKQHKARYVKLVNKGNSANTEWISLNDAKIYPPRSDGYIGIEELDIYGDDKLIADGSTLTIRGEDTSLKTITYLNVGDKCGYVFPKAQTDNIGELKARWTKGSSSRFELWFSHGINPTDSRYAYIVLPGKNEKETSDYVNANKTKVIVNNEKIQAVKDESLNATGVVFWEKGNLEKVSVDKPLIVMYTETDKEFIISVSDPTQKLESANITIDMLLTPISLDDMATSETKDGKTILTLNLKDSVGRSFEAVYQKN